jgi:hypothetical protein
MIVCMCACTLYSWGFFFLFDRHEREMSGVTASLKKEHESEMQGQNEKHQRELRDLHKKYKKELEEQKSVGFSLSLSLSLSLMRK